MMLKSLLATFATVFGLGIASLLFMRGMITRNQSALERLREEEKMEVYQSPAKKEKDMRLKRPSNSSHIPVPSVKSNRNPAH
jgi:hypothetical protein